MSNADEILKLKELLDSKVITQEEFEKKKKELLNLQSIKKGNTQNKNTTINNSPKKKSSIIGVVIGIVMFVGILTMAICNAPTLEKQLQDEVGLTNEKALQVRDILNNCGISYGTITRNGALDTESGKAYNISIDSNKNIVVLQIKDNNIYSLRTIKIENKDNEQVLYENGQKQSSLSDYITTSRTTTNTTTTNTTITERFTLVSQKGSIDSYGYITITGEIKNNTNKTYSYVQVTFNLYDESGAQIGTAMDNINNFEGNGTWKFKAIGLGSGKGITYKLVEITGW